MRTCGVWDSRCVFARLNELDSRRAASVDAKVSPGQTNIGYVNALFLIDSCSKLVYSMIRHERRAERNCWRNAQRRSTPTMEPQKRGAPDLRANRSSYISAAYEEAGFNHASSATAAVIAEARAEGRYERIWRPAAGSRARLWRKGKRLYHGRCVYYPQKQWIISLNYPFHCSRT